MSAKRLPIYCLFIPLVVIGSATAVRGQTDMGTALYGRGVHAYFSGDTTTAADHFNSAVSLGTRDPRVYYFRGLAFLREGRQYEAEADFDQAAQLEYRGITSVNVGRALERIQGAPRMKLEKVRRQTQTMLAQQRAMESPATPMVPTSPDGDPLRLRTPVQPNPTDSIQPVADAPASDTDPFAGDADVTAATVEPALPEAEPTAPTAPADDEVNPFEDESPSGGPSTDPTEEASPFDAVDEESPFDVPAEDSPASAADEPPPADEPPAPAEPAEVESPFGDEADLFGPE